MRKTFVYINSENRTSGNINDFKTTLKDSINKISKIEVKSVELPFSYYPINTNNYAINFKENGGTEHTVTLTPGIYTGTELATEIQTQMAAAYVGTTCSYDDQTIKFTIAHGSNIEIFDNTTTTAQKLLGLDGNTGLVASWTSDNVIQISGPNHLYITSHQLSIGRELSYVDNNKRDILVRVPIDVSPGEVMRHKSEASGSNDLEYDKNKSLYSVDFQVYDPDFNLVEFNGVDWSIELVVYNEAD